MPERKRRAKGHSSCVRGGRGPANDNPTQPDKSTACTRSRGQVGDTGRSALDRLVAERTAELAAANELLRSRDDVREQVEQEMRRLFSEIYEEKERLSALVNSIADEVWFADKEGQFTLLNPAAAREFLMDGSESVDVRSLATSLEVCRADGTVRPVEETPPLRALCGEVVRNEEEMVRTPATGELRYREVSSSPVKDAEGSIIGSVSVVRDITQSKLTEKRNRYLASYPARNPHPVLEFDDSGKVTYLNAAAERALPGIRETGASHPFLVGLLPFPDKAGSTSREVQVEGRWYYQGLYYAPAERIARVYALDITRRKRIEDELKRSEGQFRRLFEDDLTGDFVASPDGRILVCNPAFARIFGFRDAEEAKGSSLADLYTHPDVWADFVRLVRERGVLERHQDDRRCRDGTVIHVVENIIGTFGSKGELQQFKGYVFDDTGRKKAELELRHAHDQLERRVQERTSQLVSANVALADQAALIDLAHDAILVRDFEGEILLWSKGAERTYGWTQAQALGEPVHLLLKTELPRPFEDLKQDLMRDWHWEGELRHTCQDGRVITVASRWAVKRDVDGEPVGILEINRDITERKEAERRFGAMNTLLQLFVEKATRRAYLDEAARVIRRAARCHCVGIRVVDKDGAIPYESHIGFGRDFWQKENCLSVRDGQGVCARLVAGTTGELGKVLTQAGSFHTNNSAAFLAGLTCKERMCYRGLCTGFGYLSIGVVPIRYGDEVLGLIHVADRKKNRLLPETIDFLEFVSNLLGEVIHRFDVEEELRRHRDSLEQMVEDATAALSETNVNLEREMAERKAGEARYRAIVQDQTELICRFRPDGTLTFVNDAYCRYFGKSREELEGYRFAPLIHKDDRDRVQQAMASLGPSNETVTVEERVLLSDGTVRWQQWNARAVLDGQGSIVELQGVGRDITERQDAEEKLRQMMADLRRSNEELEQFAYVASHDLQEPLRMVASYVDLLAKRYQGQLDERADKYIEYAVGGAKRMQALVGDLLSFSRVGTGDKKFAEVDLNAVLGRAIDNLKRSFEMTGASVLNDLLPRVWGDEAQLTQLFQNVIDNAMKFRSSQTPVVRVAARADGSRWVVSIADNGIGIDPKHSRRVFRLFQRLHTQDEYPGTGIGLAICKRIAEYHNGTIWVEPGEGGGSTFFFTLPQAGPGDANRSQASRM